MNIMDQKKIGEFIAVLRKEKKLTQDELADKLGTITYEILTSVSRRVQRIYTNE